MLAIKDISYDFRNLVRAHTGLICGNIEFASYGRFIAYGNICRNRLYRLANESVEFPFSNNRALDFSEYCYGIFPYDMVYTCSVKSLPRFERNKLWLVNLGK